MRIVNQDYRKRASFTGTKFGGGGKRGRAKIPSPQPPSFLPARAFSLAREARHQFRSKKVRISSNKRITKMASTKNLQAYIVGLALGMNNLGYKPNLQTLRQKTVK
ncbi:hypothetical protein A3H10_00155 [Candidatus Uhrbacteria bacterium RIFCSPLOWO2_12_FULL_46_10]|uniref:Uncharacterized protein n=1 Tax=Candidatus Uhrbacteria bacterium RIFCSPLOWO2_01_FULL_47_25 TaxID=1802402 RepID=A0A1F7UVZ7_9BACT|nr:MAG: hypothetical protein A2752_04790 [Candidatus Uhrbacteria bacterium RIFCSPHIGHO2_01_FULL_46_23]OGL69394.1 MAG: hypothetical protein A3D60_00955 [Candidatus Uhrbacteria bacterium RIFCSPHIGHO2_02_FULL_47_29]OGL76480.1 MAG: hypothetical protein A3E96_03155 [Candidatus Uhrbacteria bacterium RIFCSPHIGHO2_12_FULL_46_13]OGL82445.1 MAG: hypothetical protein A2936_03240 [Candidatus Uhrbacteria bacterium RIFCSPLOWO2_01_FULL_47_25]OGL91235.1 MAG: hypothetical protein A3H10_00155 [Candidatus Uhrbact